MRLDIPALNGVLPWLTLLAVAMLVIVNWTKVGHLILRLLLIIAIVTAGIGYWASSQLAGWLPRWFPGQGTLANLAIILGLAALAALVFVIDWPQAWQKHKRLLVTGVILGTIMAIYGLGLYALIPGASAAEIEMQQWIHLRPLGMQIVSARDGQRDSRSIVDGQAKGELLAVTVRVTNTGRESRQLWGNFELYDVRGRRFDMDWASKLSSLDSFNPGLSSIVTLMFDVPSVRGIWWLTVYPEPFSRLDGSTAAFICP